MRKKITLLPKRNTNVPEEIVIKKGRIKQVSFMQLAEEVPESIKKIVNGPFENKFVNINVYNCKFKLRKLHSEMIKEGKLGYTHEIIIDYDEPKTSPKILPPEAVVKCCFGDRIMYAKFSWFEILKIKYYLISWSSFDTNQKIKIIGITIASVLSVIFYLLK